MINFKQTYNRAEFLNFLDKFLPEDFLNEIETINFESNYTRQVTCLGECNSLGIVVFEVQHTSTHDARVALSKEAFRLLYNRSTKNKALVLFVPIDNPETYRFSLVSIDVELDEHKVRKSYSNPRRYSYLLGEGAKVYTPTKYLSVKGRVKDSKDLLDRFSVEVLTKEFYNELFTWYQWALSDEIGVTFPNDRSTESDDRKIEEHLIRLITRLMFVWFIKQKKLVPDLLFEVDKLKSLLKNFEATDGKQDTYYRAILQNLFFATLNNKIEEREFAVDGGFYENKVQYGIKTLFRYADEFSVPKEQVIQIFGKVPFLNGGLFECLDKDTPDSNGKIMYSDGFSRRKDKQSRAFIPNILFFDPVKGILSILNKYNFTIEENSPLDIEVALDPELLGKVFENLLGTYNPETKETARKQSGSFYTPREIVQYMVDESLVAHLKRTVGDELEDEYRKLINHTDESVALAEQQKSDIFKSLKACKILDPACGSGAFPMGILNRMLAIIERLPIPANISIYDLKLYLIENCIYGIDIQSIAVQISKLRFFISLICEQIPNGDSTDNYGIKPLPNLETKFVAANTLIGLTPKKAQLNLFEDPQIEVTRTELMQVRHKHFLASTSKQKKECRDEDKKLREKLAHLLDDNGNFAPEDARQLADWNPYDQNASSPFFDPEWMFGIKDGFDVVIGNPPYGVKFSKSEKETLKILFEGYQGNFEIYFFFIEFSRKALKNSNGVVSLITPDTWLAIPQAQKLRKYILEISSIPSILVMPEKVFEAVSVNSIVFFITSHKVDYSNIVIFNRKDSLSNLNEFANMNNYQISKNDWLKDNEYKISVYCKSDILELLAKIHKDSFPGIKYFDISQGIIPYSKENHSEEIISERKFHSQGKIDDTYGKWIQGRVIKRYLTEFSSGEFLKYGKWLHRPRDKKYFQGNRILVQEITGGHPARISAAFCKEILYHDPGIISCINISSINTKYLLAIINSKLISFYHGINSPKGKRNAFPKILIGDLRKLPIKKPSKEQENIVVGLVDKVLIDLNSLKVIDDKIDLVIYKIYNLSYNDVIIVDPEIGSIITDNEYINLDVEAFSNCENCF